MLDSILGALVNWIEHVISVMGPLGISMLMAIESCNVPLPSEAVLPFDGYLVSKGELSFHIAVITCVFGCVLSSVPTYYLGYFRGKKFFEKYGKYLIVTKKDLDEA